MKKFALLLSLLLFVCFSSFSQEVVNLGQTVKVGQTLDLDETGGDTTMFRISSVQNFDYRITCIGSMVADTIVRTVYIYESPTRDDGYVLTDSIVVNGDDYNYTDSYTNTTGMVEWVKMITGVSATTQTNNFKFYATVKKDE